MSDRSNKCQGCLIRAPDSGSCVVVTKVPKIKLGMKSRRPNKSSKMGIAFHKGGHGLSEEGGHAQL